MNQSKLEKLAKELTAAEDSLYHLNYVIGVHRNHGDAYRRTGPNHPELKGGTLRTMVGLVDLHFDVVFAVLHVQKGYLEQRVTELREEVAREANVVEVAIL